MANFVYGYGRVSSYKQDISLEVQEEACLKYHDLYKDEKFKSRKWGGFFGDSGTSGGMPWIERPQGEILFGRIRPGDSVICKKLDRAFRSCRDACDVLIDMTNLSIWLHVIDSPFDTSTPEGRCFLQIMAAFAEMEREKIRDRIVEAKAHMAAKGQPTNHAPYGYGIEGKGVDCKFVPIAEEQAYATMILYLSQTMSEREIAKHLKRKGLRCPKTGYFPSYARVHTLKKKAKEGFLLPDGSSIDALVAIKNSAGENQ